jgi:hypothetical protein
MILPFVNSEELKDDKRRNCCAENRLKRAPASCKSARRVGVDAENATEFCLKKFTAFSRIWAESSNRTGVVKIGVPVCCRAFSTSWAYIVEDLKFQEVRGGITRLCARPVDNAKICALDVEKKNERFANQK